MENQTRVSLLVCLALIVVIITAAFIIPEHGSKDDQSSNNNIYDEGVPENNEENMQNSTSQFQNASWLHTEGRWIMDDNGNIIRFLGVGRLDLSVYFDDAHEPWGPQAVEKGIETEVAYDFLKRAGVNIVRIGLNRGAILENPDMLLLIDKIVDWCKERNIRIDFDLMRWNKNPGSNGPLVEWNEIVGPNPPQAWIDFFVMLARRYVDEPTVCMFNIFNEPAYYKAVSLTMTETMEIWNNRVTQVARAIHAVNPNLLISVDIPRFQPRKWEIAGVEYWIDEPNIVYAVHHYYKSELDWNQPGWALEYRDGNFDSAIEHYEQWMINRYFWVAEQRNKALWMDETGVYYDESKYPNSLRQIWDEYQILGNHSIGFVQWVWNAEWHPRDTTTGQLVIPYTMLQNNETRPTLNEIGQLFAKYLSSL